MLPWRSLLSFSLASCLFWSQDSLSLLSSRGLPIIPGLCKEHMHCFHLQASKFVSWIPLIHLITAWYLDFILICSFIFLNTGCLWTIFFLFFSSFSYSSLRRDNSLIFSARWSWWNRTLMEERLVLMAILVLIVYFLEQFLWLWLLWLGDYYYQWGCMTVKGFLAR